MRQRKQIFTDILFIIAGTALAALAIDVFLEPNHISPGGMTGVATALNYLTDLPAGVVLIMINIPLVAFAAKQIGAKFLIKTAAATVLLSVMLDLFAVLLPTYTGNRLLAAIYGGVLSGTGLAMVFLRGGTTGGTDIIAKLVNLRYPHFSIGRVLLIFDAAVCVFAAAVYRDVETALYSVVVLFASSRLLDSILYGGDKGKLFYIFTRSTDEVAARIMKDMNRGVTLISATGAYSGEQRPMLLCAVRYYQSAELRRIVHQCDSDAFMVVAPADEILGYGFRR